MTARSRRTDLRRRHDRDVLDRRIDTRGVAEIKRSRLQTERLGDPFDFIKIASGQDGRAPLSLAAFAMSLPV